MRHVKEAKPATTEAFPMNDIRRYKLKEIIYPSIILAIAAVEGNDNALRRSEKEAIPEFMRFNIVEMISAMLPEQSVEFTNGRLS